MPIRFSGIASGLDTDSMVKELMKAQSYKKTKVQNQITILDWKKERWQDINSKIYKLYTGSLSKMRLQNNYRTKEVSSSDETKVTVTGDATAVAGNHRLKIIQLASSQYVTGEQLVIGNDETNNILGTSTLRELGFQADELSGTDTIIIKSGNKNTYLDVSDNTTLNDFIARCKSAGINANYDANQKRIFLSSTASGEKNGFEITSCNSTIGTYRNNIRKVLDYSQMNEQDKLKVDMAIEVFGNNLSTEDEKDKAKKVIESYLENDNSVLNTALTEYSDNVANIVMISNNNLSKLGFQVSKNEEGNFTLDQNVSTYIKAHDSKVDYNGVILTGTTNTIKANGLVFNLKGVTEKGETQTQDEIIQLTVSQDTKAVYDMVKTFLKDYNELLGELNTLYEAPSSRGYDPLTDEEKEAMTDKEVELWETKIKDSLLRRDNTVNSVVSVLKSISSMKVSVDGKTYSLSTFGINTVNYSEKGKLHLDGDKDDIMSAGNPDKLMTALSDNPEVVAKVLGEFSMKLYTGLQDKMKSTTLSSALTVYNDKEILKTKERYEKELSKLEERLLMVEERYYNQFTAMEKALAQLNNQSNSLASLLGTSTN